MAIQQYPRATTEFVPVSLTGNGAPVTSGVRLSVVPDGPQPGTWQPAVTRGQAIGFVLTGLTPGYFRVWAQATDGSYTPVIDCGLIQVV